MRQYGRRKLKQRRRICPVLVLEIVTECADAFEDGSGLCLEVNIPEVYASWLVCARLNVENTELPLEAIAHTGDGQNQFGAAGVALRFLAQAANVDIDRAFTLDIRMFP